MSNRFLRTFRDKSHILGSSFGNRGAIFSLKLNPSSFGFFSPFLNRSVGFSSSSFFTSHFRHFPGCVRRIEVSPPHPGTQSHSERASRYGKKSLRESGSLGRVHSSKSSGSSAWSAPLSPRLGNIVSKSRATKQQSVRGRSSDGGAPSLLPPSFLSSFLSVTVPLWPSTPARGPNPFREEEEGEGDEYSME